MADRQTATPSPQWLSDLRIPRPDLHFAQGLNPSVRSSQVNPFRDDSDTSSSSNNSTAHLPASSAAPGAATEGSHGAAGPSKKRRLIRLGALAGLVVVVLAIVLPVAFLVGKKHNDNTAASSGVPSSPGDNSTTESGGKTVVGAVTGGDGSTVIMANGESFTYTNPFGGYWLADPENPFATGAKPNSWTPALNETWTWGVDRVNGVNLGGWFVLEPFIAPALFQLYPSASDEWSLSTLMRADGTLQAKLEEHYDTFITEQDIAQIAGAGLNWVRLPIPFWAISSWSDVGVDADGNVESEPFLEGVAWKYIVRLFGWARKYGIRVNLDLHTIPGSQNGYNHSGKFGQINFLNGIMGIANAQRAMDYIRIITEFISQPEYRDVIPMFSIVNEARMADIGRDQLTSFYLEAHTMIRDITGLGAGNGPFISIHDGFQPATSWAGFLTGSDRIILDIHPYLAFSGAKNDDPIATGEDPDNAGGTWPEAACNHWGTYFNTSRSQFGITVAGEFSNGYNDCGLYVTGVNGTQTYGGDCSLWEDSSTWNATVTAGVREFALASMDSLGDWFFWTWKIGKAADGVVRSPLWSYQLGLEGGWMPTDPRKAQGKCAAIGVKGVQFDGKYSAWQTGGAGAGTIAASSTAKFGQWPPATISGVDAGAMKLLPTYTATGSIPTLTFITPTVTGIVATVTPTVSIGNGWFDAADTMPAITAVAGCTYPAAWSALSLPAPTARCTGA
ncbi:glycoside hydrolase [Mycena capillaripes]|nr:glycoside hydrolase [Mycena capillaripes]